MTQTTKQIPEKHAKLKQAEAAGLLVPESLLLDFEEQSSGIQGSIQRFSEKRPNSRFIVRSAHLSEDGGDYSLAGHFWSSGPVTAEQLSATIKQAQEENAVVMQALESDEFEDGKSVKPPKLVLQEYIEHDLGGVLFSPWSFFPDYAYIEYSETGVKQVVEGDASSSAVLCLDLNYPDPLALPEVSTSLKQQLVELCCQLRELFDFPIDCEWAYELESQRVVVLQVRPQTHSVGPILPYSALEAQAWASNIPISKSEISSSLGKRWQFTALSESLGRLSPLSFSLLQQLYIDATPLFRKLGCKAGSVDFMGLAPDGSVLVDPDLEAQFYSMTLFGGFRRGIQQANLSAEATVVLKQYDGDALFSYTVLQELFAYWMAANLLSSGAGRSGSESVEFTEPAHAYELSWPAVLMPIDIENAKIKANDFEVLNAWGRALFLFELNKLKLELKQKTKQEGQSETNSEKRSVDFRIDRNNAYLYFSTWHELVASGIILAPAPSTNSVEACESGLASSQTHESAKLYQHKLAPLAIYDYALTSSASSEKIQALSSTKPAEGPLQIITNPASSTDPIKADHILVAAYFDNRWVSKLKSLKGIVVSKGSRLSHSAIVAREHDVPYYVVAELDLKKLNQGQETTLDPNTVTTEFT